MLFVVLLCCNNGVLSSRSSLTGSGLGSLRIKVFCMNYAHRCYVVCFVVVILLVSMYSGHLFTKRTDVLLQDRVKSRRREIRVKTFRIARKFDRHLGSNAAEMPVKSQSNTIIITSNLAASRLHEIGG